MKRLRAIAFLLCIFVSVGCTQFPTEKSNIVDMRPTISFKFEDDSFGSARVMIDGADSGAIEDYIDGEAALKVLSGTHLVQVKLNGKMLIEQKIYVGDGVNRTILVQ